MDNEKIFPKLLYFRKVESIRRVKGKIGGKFPLYETCSETSIPASFQLIFHRYSSGQRAHTLLGMNALSFLA